MSIYDVVTIGNALVDVLSHEDDEFIARTGVERGAMTMVDAARSDEIYAEMGPATEASGGSAANTAAGLASFGGTAAYVGRVADDTFGKVFTHDLRSIGVHFDSPLGTDGLPTGRCLIMITGDAQRTMCTYLGTANLLDRAAVAPALIRNAAVTFVEGYLWDQPVAKDAIRHAADLAHGAGNKFSLTLSDPFCVDRHRAEFRQLVEHEIDILFANELEITMLYEVDTFDDALAQVRGHVEIAALTRGALGSVIVAGGDVFEIEPHPVDVVDTTGAGDQYAAGFLFGYTHGYPLPVCGALASLAAGEVISHLGARPEVPLEDLGRDLLAR
jgi:sugar/nucleoside kinase (ribokinase family)